MSLNSLAVSCFNTSVLFAAISYHRIKNKNKNKIIDFIFEHFLYNKFANVFKGLLLLAQNKAYFHQQLMYIFLNLNFFLVQL